MGNGLTVLFAHIVPDLSRPPLIMSATPKPAIDVLEEVKDYYGQVSA